MTCFCTLSAGLHWRQRIQNRSVLEVHRPLVLKMSAIR
nr:MAG TPA: hypothetical protein [Caudoviricetes sp.]